MQVINRVKNFENQVEARLTIKLLWIKFTLKQNTHTYSLAHKKTHGNLFA